MKSKLESLYEIELACANRFNYRQNIIVPNISWGAGMNECDLLVIKPNGYMIEIEIKRSVADFKADFKKKHEHNRLKTREFYYCFPIKLLEKIEKLIPEDCGIITISTNYNDHITANYHRFAERNNKAIKLSDKQIINISRLGCMRIWPLKRKIIHKRNLFNQYEN